VDLPDQPDRHRQFWESREAEVHGANVVDDFFDVGGATIRGDLGFLGEQVLEGALRAFDLAGEHGFPPDIHVNEEVGVGQSLDRPVQPTEGAVRVGQLMLQRHIDP
jgi:hypothetical protein